MPQPVLSPFPPNSYKVGVIMLRTNRLTGDAGVRFENATYGYSLSCPSRATFDQPLTVLAST